MPYQQLHQPYEGLLAALRFCNLASSSNSDMVMSTGSFFHQWSLSRTSQSPSHSLALSQLHLKWEAEPEPCHDFRLFLKRSRDHALFCCASSSSYADLVTELWDVNERVMLHRFPSPRTQTCCMDFLSDHSSYVTGGHDATLTLWREGQRMGQ